jgi:hypothetical protein
VGFENLLLNEGGQSSLWPAAVTPSSVRWDFYQDPETRWRWQRMDRNGEVQALSTGSYDNLIDCLANAITAGYTYSAPASVRQANPSGY